MKKPAGKKFEFGLPDPKVERKYHELLEIFKKEKTSMQVRDERGFTITLSIIPCASHYWKTVLVVIETPFSTLDDLSDLLNFMSTMKVGHGVKLDFDIKGKTMTFRYENDLRINVNERCEEIIKVLAKLFVGHDLLKRDHDNMSAIISMDGLTHSMIDKLREQKEFKDSQPNTVQSKRTEEDK